MLALWARSHRLPPLQGRRIATVCKPRHWEYPGKCQFTSYFQCMTENGKDAKCKENPKYEYARKRPALGR